MLKAVYYTLAPTATKIWRGSDWHYVTGEEDIDEGNGHMDQTSMLKQQFIMNADGNLFLNGE